MEVLSTIRDTDRTVDLLLYITAKLRNAQYGGAVNLNKVLYYIDGLNFITRGEPVSSFKYVKRQFGPTPDGAFMNMREAMITQGLLREETIPFHGLSQKRLIPLESARLDRFTLEEIDLINDIVDVVGGVSATAISNITHDVIWDMALMGEEIPLHCFILQPREPSEKDMVWGNEVVANAPDHMR